MIPQIKSEIRKLLTVRSTYILVLVAMALIVLFTYVGTSGTYSSEITCVRDGHTEIISEEAYMETSPEELCEGGNVNYNDKYSDDVEKDRLLFGLQEIVPVISLFASIILVLLVAHEFRHNTISYTLTISNSRSRVVAAKLLVSAAFVLLATLLAMGVAVGTFFVAASIKGLNVPAQDFDWLYIVGRHLTYSLGFTLFGMGIALLVRNLTAAIAALFVLPTINDIAGYLLSTRDYEPTKLLPFSALNRVGNVVTDVMSSSASFIPSGSENQASVMQALAVFAAYLVGVWLISWILFIKRDGN